MLEILPYSTQFNDQLIALFYQSVHAIDDGIYNQQQKSAWAPYPIDYQKWSQRFIATKPFLLMNNQQVIAFIEFTERGYIDCLYVSDKQQRQGYATLLIQYVLQIARSKQLASVSVHASEMAKPLFLRLGFECVQQNQQLRNGVLLSNYSMSLPL